MGDENTAQCECVCMFLECRTATDYSPTAPIAIDDLTYKISATIMKFMIPPPYCLQFIKGLVHICDVKVGLKHY